MATRLASHVDGIGLTSLSFRQKFAKRLCPAHI